MKTKLFEPGETPQTVPDCYCWIEECRSGSHWLVTIPGNAKLDLARILKQWARSEMDSRIDGAIMSRLAGDFYASIITDGRPVDSVVVWQSGGFYLSPNYTFPN